MRCFVLLSLLATYVELPVDSYYYVPEQEQRLARKCFVLYSRAQSRIADPNGYQPSAFALRVFLGISRFLPDGEFGFVRQGEADRGSTKLTTTSS